MTAGGDAEREGQVRTAGWEIMDDGYARTIGSRRGFSLPPLIGKIIDQSQAGVCECSQRQAPLERPHLATGGI